MVIMQLVSPRDFSTARSLIEKDQKSKKPKVRRFNSKVFERAPVDVSTVDEFSLKPQELPLHEKRQCLAELRTHGFRWALTTSILTVIAIISAFTDNEMSYYEQITPLQSSALRVLVIAVSAVQILIAIQYEQIQLKRRVLHGLQHPKCKQ